MYGDGLGVPKNYVFAYALSNFAAAAGEEKAITLRDWLEAKMSPEQIGKAQDMTHQWNDLSQIKDHKFFPDWMNEPPEYTLLQKEAAAKKRKAIKSNANFAKLVVNLFEQKVNDVGHKEPKLPSTEATSAPKTAVPQRPLILMSPGDPGYQPWIAELMAAERKNDVGDKEPKLPAEATSAPKTDVPHYKPHQS